VLDQGAEALLLLPPVDVLGEQQAVDGAGELQGDGVHGGEQLPGDRRPTEISESLIGWAHVHARLALIEPAGAPSAASAAQRRGADTMNSD
jgi:hypothetical protein